MAGAHVDTPGHRLLWSQHVTHDLPLQPSNYMSQVFWYDDTVGPSVPSYSFQEFNDRWMNADSELANQMFDPLVDYGHDDTHPFVVVIVFDDPVDLTGYYINVDGGTVDALSVSKDTTDGTDGTWENIVPSPVVDSGGLATVNPGYRDDVQTWPDPKPTGVKAVSFRHSGAGEPGGINKFHLYGDWTTTNGLDWTANNNRLAFWHPTLNARIDGSWFDVGDTPRGSSRDIKFRLKNLSPTRTVTNAQADYQTMPVSGAEPLYFGTDYELADYLTFFSIDGLLFQPTGSLPSGGGITLGPQSISQVMTLRIVAPTDAPLGNYTARLRAYGLESFGANSDPTVVRFATEAAYYGDISTNVPTPHIWFIRPASGREGDNTFVFGHGFGDTDATYNGNVEYSGVPMLTGAWDRIPGTISQTRYIDTQALDFQCEHGIILATIPTSVDDGLITVVTNI